MTTEKFLRQQQELLNRLLKDSSCTIDVTNDFIEHIDKHAQLFELHCKSGNFIQSEVVAFATGTDLYCPSIKNLHLNKCYSFKDYPFSFITAKDKVLMLGAGHTASELYSEFYNNVADILIVDISNGKYNTLNRERKEIFKKAKIVFSPYYQLKQNEIIYNEQGENNIYRFDYIVLCTGEKSNIACLPNNIFDNDTEQIIIDQDHEQLVNISKHWQGFFAMGDVKHELHTSNISYAIADGMRTALSIKDYLYRKR
jgi:thioredoxin reductase